MKCSQSRWFVGLASDPSEGAYDAPTEPLVMMGFLSSAMVASLIRRLQLPRCARSSRYP